MILEIAIIARGGAEDIFARVPRPPLKLPSQLSVGADLRVRPRAHT